MEKEKKRLGNFEICSPLSDRNAAAGIISQVKKFFKVMGKSGNLLQVRENIINICKRC